MHSLLGKRGAVLAGLLALVMTAMVPSVASAGPEPAAKGRGFRLFARSLGALTVNRIYCGLSSTGEICVDSTNSSTIGGGYWPKGTPDQYIFNSGLQIAGVIGADGGPWADDTTGAFFFDPKGTTQHGEEVRPIFNSSNPADLAAWPEAAIVEGDLFDPLLHGRAVASQGDIWFMSWDGNPGLNAGRPHPLGVLVETRGMGWNFPSGNEDILYFIYTFYNITTTSPAAYAGYNPALQEILLEKAQDFQALNEQSFDITLPDEGYTITDMYAAFASDNDVADAGANYSSVNLPFALGYTYEHTFTRQEALGWIFPADIFGDPFFPGVGFIGMKYLKSPTGAGQIQLYSNTLNSATGFRDPQNTSQLFRYLSGNISTAAGDQACNVDDPRVCFIAPSAADTRFFQSSTALTLAPGGSGQIVIAYIMAAPVGSNNSYVPSAGADVKPGNVLATATASVLETPGAVPLVDSLTGFLGWEDDPLAPDGIPQQSEFAVVPRSLLGKSITAQQVFDGGFLLPFAPESPDFYLVPGDNQVSVLWSPSASETTGDPFFQIAQQPLVLDPSTNTMVPNLLFDPNYRQFDVEGYRIYRGRVDAPGDLQLIAQYDYEGTSITDFYGRVNPNANCAPELGIFTSCGAVQAPVAGVVPDSAGVEYALSGEIIQIAPGGRVALADSTALIVTSDTAVTSSTGTCGPRSSCPPLSDTGVPFIYVDTDVRNNFRYFYSVTAFDINSRASAPSNLESPRVTKAVTPRPEATNLASGELTFGLFGADGTQLDPSGSWSIDAETGIFDGPPPPTNAYAAAFAPFVPALLPALSLTATIDSIIVEDPRFYNCPATNGLGTCTVFHLTFDKDGEIIQAEVPTVWPVWSSFDASLVTATLGAVPFEVDPDQLERYGLPAGLRGANAGVQARLYQSIDYSSHEGQSARRGRHGDAISTSVGGSRWFAGTENTVADPTVGIRVGHIEGVDTIFAPQPYIDVNLATPLDAAEIAANSGTIQWFGYAFALLGRQADMQLTWGAGGTVASFEDVTHHVPVMFKDNVQASYGFVQDGNGNGLIDWGDFQYPGKACEWWSESFPATTGCLTMAELTPLVETAAITPTSTSFSGAWPQTGQGFGLYVAGQYFIFEMPGGALPAEGDVWTLRQYTGRVDAANNEATADPSGYRYREGTARSAAVPGLQIIFNVSEGTSVTEVTAADLSNVHTVPDPYYVTNAFEQTTDNKVIQFVNLPQRALIRIYSASGILVDVIEHESGSLGGSAAWDLRNRNNQVVASGVYFYHVESGDERKIGKFTVVNFAQ